MEPRLVPEADQLTKTDFRSLETPALFTLKLNTMVGKARHSQKLVTQSFEGVAQSVLLALENNCRFSPVYARLVSE